MNIKPLGDRVMVKVFENSEHSYGGIFTGQPTTTFVRDREKAVQKTVGTVVAIGQGNYNDEGYRQPPECSIGDVICFSDTCGIKVDDEHLMIREQDIAFFMDELKTIFLIYKD